MPSLLAALSRTDENAWHRSQSGQRTLTWLPLWLITSSGLWIGLDRSARWVVGRVSSQVSPPSPPLSPSWLPLLDHDESEVKEELSFISTKYDLPLEQLMDTLPIDEAIKLALTTSNAHWIDRALAWLKFRGISEDLIPMLLHVSNSKSASQQARQSATRLVQRAKRGLPS